MRVSYNWLQTYIDLPWDAEEMAKRYTQAGLEYDEILDFGDDFSGVVVAKVLSCAAVEGSDHLHICKVDVGASEPLDIICGAPNVREGLLVACAKVGAVLPGDFTISARKTFGHLSQGMLCSQKELGLAEDHSGIWELNSVFEGREVPLGEDIRDALELRDKVLLIELTPNRSDCLGMINLAREAAAYTGGEVRYPDLDYEEAGGDIADDITITVEDAKLCPRYAARLVKNIKIGPSPLWMQNYLRSAGMRPINNVVDISNFVMLEMNQPLHTFDYQQLRGKKINVRAAHAGEEMTTLDGKERKFRGDEILICDGEGPVCVAGIMGGLESEVTEATTDVLIEAAAFDPVHIRKAARSLGIPSEASMRFEKGVDIASCDNACRRAAQLLVKYCGGIAQKGVVDVCGTLPEPVDILLRRAKVNGILGTAFTLDEISHVIKALGFAPRVQGEDALMVTVPTYRGDISIEVDLIEEVARLIGYEHIPKTIPMNATAGGRSAAQVFMVKLKNACAAAGLYEAVNYSFIHPGEADAMLLAADDDRRRMLPISNPLSEDQSVMRRSLLPGLLHSAARNQARRILDIRLFETGMIYIPAMENMLEEQPKEIDTLSMLICGAPATGWQGNNAEYDFFTLKGIVERIFARLNLAVTFDRITEPFLHPGRAAAIFLDGLEIGRLGEIHPTVAENYQLEGRILVAELTLPPVISAALALGNTDHELPKYPASTRDIAVIGSSDVPACRVETEIKAAGGEYLRGVRLFDLYDKAPIPEGSRSLAYALEFRSDEGTLTDKEVDAAFENIVSVLKSKLGYKLR